MANLEYKVYFQAVATDGFTAYDDEAFSDAVDTVDTYQVLSLASIFGTGYHYVRLRAQVSTGARRVCCRPSEGVEAVDLVENQWGPGGCWAAAGLYVGQMETWTNADGEIDIACDGSGTLTIDVTGAIEESLDPPVVTSQAATNVLVTSATGNGNITDDGEASITEHGVCWKAGSDPVDIAGSDDYTTEGAGSEGAFTSTIDDLIELTTYYFRPYATNSEDTTYGAAQSFTTKLRPRIM